MNRQRRSTEFALAALFAFNLMNFFDRQLISVVTEPIRKLWGLSDSQLGWLGTAFTLLYAMVGVPLGRLSDRRNRPTILAAGIGLWSLLTAASGLAWSFGSLFAARLGVGVGEASCAPAANSMIGDLYPPARRAFALSVFQVGLPIGIFLGSYIGGELAAAYGWRAPFFVACVPGLLLAGLAFLLTDPERGATESSPGAARVHEGSPYWRVLRIPTMSWIIISGALFNFNAYAIYFFMPAFLSRYHGLNLKNANITAAFILGAVGVPGLLLGGWAVDRASRVRWNGRLLVSAIAFLVAAPCMFFALNRPAGELGIFMTLMACGWMLCYVYYSGVYAAVQDVVEPSLRGTAMAIYFFAMYALGGSFGPVLTGKLSDHFTRRAMTAAGATAITEPFRAVGLHRAMYVIPLLTLILVAVLFAASLTVEKDMRALRSWMGEPADADSPPPARQAPVPSTT
ncbi:MAG TPA: MFS transporter [Candidatus Acidoferrales bacterium]|nr:MFS transporter [Candidatus Acidoferrales bacterium]